jgi:hypothetical protein
LQDGYDRSAFLRRAALFHYLRDSWFDVAGFGCCFATRFAAAFQTR